MCYRQLSDKAFYNNSDNNDLPNIFEERVNNFAEKCKSIIPKKGI